MWKIQNLLIARDANLERGFVNIQSTGWNTVTMPSIPCAFPTLAIVLIAAKEWEEVHTAAHVQFELIDADGRSIIPSDLAEQRFPLIPPVDPSRGPGDDQVVQVVVALKNLIITQKGAYAVVVKLNGIESARATFRVVAA